MAAAERADLADLLESLTPEQWESPSLCAERIVEEYRTHLRPRGITAAFGGRIGLTGLRFVATDLDWSHGEGQEVYGPGEALLVAVAGRASALGDLSGDGVDELARRVRG